MTCSQPLAAVTLPEGVWHTDYKATPAELTDVVQRMAAQGEVLAHGYSRHNKRVLRTGRGYLYFEGAQS